MLDKNITVFGNINGEIRRRNISQEKLCEELGIERRRYVNWQQKGDMPFSYFMRIAALLGCSLDYLARDVKPSLTQDERNLEWG